MPEDSTLGPNAWLVDEMYERYRADPESVSESWQDFFADFEPGGNGEAEPRVEPVEPAPTKPQKAPKAEKVEKVEKKPPKADRASDQKEEEKQPAKQAAAREPAEVLRGAPARIVANMEASLAVPTATSTRVVPARLLEVNRKVINGYLGRTGGGRVSVTHLVGWAVVKATETVPAMRQSFAGDAEHPAVVRHPHVGLGLAVDVER